MKQPKDLTVILDRIRTSENWRDSTYKDGWERDLKAYRSRHLGLPEAGRSNVFVPYTFMQVETVKARVAESLFATRPYVTLIPRGAEDSDTAKAVQMLLDWQMNDRMNIKALFSEDVLADCIIFGTVVTYTGWLKKMRKTKQRVTAVSQLIDETTGQPYLDETGQPVTIEMESVEPVEIPVYDDPIAQKVDLFDFYTDPYATNTQDARYCGHREWLSREDIEGLEKTAGWDVDWKSLQPDDTILGGKQIRAESMGNTLNGDVSSTASADDGKSLYKVHHYWEDERHIVILNGTQCVLDEENPYWHGMKPYDKCCYVPLSGEFYGVGIPEVLKDLQAELNTSRNQRIDWNSMALRRMWKMRKGCGLEPKDLVWRQNGVIQLDDMDDLMEINVQNLPASAFTNEDVIKRDMRDATGCHDILMGLTDRADETATTTMTKDNNASIRFKYFIEAVVSDLMLPIAQKCLALDQQYLEQGRLVRVVDNPRYGDAIFDVKMEDLQNQYDLIYVGTSVEPIVNRENYKNNVMQVFNLAMSNPLVQQDPNAQIELLRELMTANDIKDVDNKLPQMPQMQPGQPGAAGNPGDPLQNIDMGRVQQMAEQIMAGNNPESLG